MKLVEKTVKLFGLDGNAFALMGRSGRRLNAKVGRLRKLRRL